MSDSILEPEEHVLSTLEADGTRRWLKPRLSHGNLLWRRRIVAYLLIAIFTLLPFVRINGKPAILLDIAARKFTIFGFTFLPTDTVLLALFMVGLLLSIFLLTSLFGRVWCGWACPQTVYMEFVYRPIERFFEGTTSRGGRAKKKVATWRTFAMYAAYLLVSIYLANTFLSYFVGVEKLKQWVTQSPVEHPIPFLVMSATVVAMMFDFCFFREQLCIIACPYGRFQSVLLDNDSLIVAYDEKRGEPRGKAKKKKDDSLPLLGDCVDCRNCVTTCPTGIDIRKGLQMECINCTQCIDACNIVMGKLGRQPNLIRYSSQARDRGAKASLLRARTIIYPLLLATVASIFLVTLFSRTTFDAVILREPGNPYTLTEDGQVRNLFRLKLTNRSEQAMTFSTSALKPASTRVTVNEDEFALKPGKVGVFHIEVVAPREEFSIARADMKLEVRNEKDDRRTIDFKLIGPYD